MDIRLVLVGVAVAIAVTAIDVVLRRTARPVGPRRSLTDLVITTAATLTTLGLAGVAGAVSYDHLRELAESRGEHGWKAHAFPLTVDGIEVVATLAILADRRAGRPSGRSRGSPSPPAVSSASARTSSSLRTTSSPGSSPAGPRSRSSPRSKCCRGCSNTPPTTRREVMTRLNRRRAERGTSPSLTSAVGRRITTASGRTTVRDTSPTCRGMTLTCRGTTAMTTRPAKTSSSLGRST
ncbi:DUF2637 domain-containing protein [Micromonospora parva]|uniref:DUF2637 domain-containing protein n=1 Tax=Micromonospora parva TaxID=1464048 RepID=UPI0033EEC631